MGKRQTNVPEDTDLLPFAEGSSSWGAELLDPPEVQAAKYSGLIVEKNQERVDGILGARAMDFPIRLIMATFHVSAHTIAALEARHQSKLATLKKRLAGKFGVFVELGLDRAIATVDRMDVDKLMVSLGIATDKMQVLTGEPSSIVGTADGPKVFSIDTLNARLSRRDREVPGEFTELPPTGSEGEKTEPTRASGDQERAEDAHS